MRKLSFLLLYLVSFLVSAQSDLGNTWYAQKRDYLKIVIKEDGLYEISVQDLVNNGWNLSNITPENLQLYLLGKEVAIELLSANNSAFQVTDKIRFYAEKNKGQLDSLVYRPNSIRANKNQSLFSDEAAYFLCVGTGNGKRMKINSLTNGTATSNKHYTHHIQALEQQYSYNNIIGLLPPLQQSYYEYGEGWSGNFLMADSAKHSFNLQFPKRTSDSDVLLTIRLNGRSNNIHQLRYAINGQIATDTLVFGNFDIFEKEINVPSAQLVNGLKIDFYPIKQSIYDWFSVQTFESKYWQGIEDQKIIYAEANQNYSGQQMPYAFVVDEPTAVEQLKIENNQFVSPRNAKVFLTNKTLKPAVIKAVKFDKKYEDVNYFILTHPSLLTGARAVDEYRSSEKGGSFKTAILYAEELYDYYTYGFRNPEAVRRFSKVYHDNTNTTKYLFLIGRPITFPDVLKTQANQDLVPGYGYPGSDALLTADENDVQRMATGRLNVTNSQQIINYLNKVKEKEGQTEAYDWENKILHLSGGKTEFELETLAYTLENIKSTGQNYLLAGEISTIRKKSTDDVENVSINKEVNSGVGMISFVGHGSANFVDLNMGYCSDPKFGFENKGKYPLMYFNGCGVGNVYYRYDPLTTDWLITPDKGAIAVFANSFWSYLFPTQLFLNQLYEQLFVNEKTAGLSLGEIHQQVNRNLGLFKSNPYILANMHQVILQGDPAIKMFPLQAADFSINQDKLQLISADQSKSLGLSEEVVVNIPLRNLGRQIKDQTDLKLTINYDNGSETKILEVPAFRADTSLSLVFKKGDKAIKSLDANVNESKKTDELSFSNNIGSLVIDNWAEASSFTGFPSSIIEDKIPPVLQVKINGKIIENNDFVPAETVVQINLSDENSLKNASNELLRVQLQKEGEGSESIFIPAESISFLNNNTLRVNLPLTLNPGTYLMTVISQDARGNQISKPFQINFRVSDKTESSDLRIFSNPLINQENLVFEYELIATKNPKSVNYHIHDTNGRLLSSKNITGLIGKNIQTESIKSLAPGNYVLSLEVAWGDYDEKLSKRFTVQ